MKEGISMDTPVEINADEDKQDKPVGKKTARKISFKLKSITPKEDISSFDLEPYTVALDQAFDDSAIRNIAVIGPQGSGKSSIIRSYFKQKEYLANEAGRKYKKPMYISLSEFECNDPRPLRDEKISREARERSDKSEQAGVSLNEGARAESFRKTKDLDEPRSLSPDELSAKLESEIINQVVQRSDSGKISESRFKKLERPHKALTALKCIPVALALLILICFICFEPVSKILSEGQIAFLRQEWVVAVFALMAFTLCLWLVYLAYRAVMQQRILKGVSISNLFDFELRRDDPLYRSPRERSVGFNAYLSEVLYLFRECGFETFVFEDLERFHNVQIFTQLRMINHLLNDSEGKSTGTPIRFIFLLNDAILISEERTKFFDFILPVVPYVIPSNAYQKLREMMDEIKGNNEFPSDDCIDFVAGYMKNARELHNLVNEFQIYSTICKSARDDMVLNELLVLLAYKSISPEDFDALHQKSGFFYYAVKDAVRQLREEVQRDKRKRQERRQLRWHEELAKIDESAIEEDKARTLGITVKENESIWLAGRRRGGAKYHKLVEKARKKNKKYDSAIEDARQRHQRHRQSLEAFYSSLYSTGANRQSIPDLMREGFSSGISARKRMKELLWSQMEAVAPAGGRDGASTAQCCRGQSKGEQQVEFITAALSLGYLTDECCDVIAMFHEGDPSSNETEFLYALRHGSEEDFFDLEIDAEKVYSIINERRGIGENDRNYLFSKPAFNRSYLKTLMAHGDYSQFRYVIEDRIRKYDYEAIIMAASEDESLFNMKDSLLKGMKRSPIFRQWLRVLPGYFERKSDEETILTVESYILFALLAIRSEGEGEFSYDYAHELAQWLRRHREDLETMHADIQDEIDVHIYWEEMLSCATDAERGELGLVEEDGEETERKETKSTLDRLEEIEELLSQFDFENVVCDEEQNRHEVRQ